MSISNNIFDVIQFKQWLIEKFQLKQSTINHYTNAVARFLSKNPDIYNLEDYNNFIVQYGIKKRAPYYAFILKKYIDFKIPDATTRNKLKDGILKLGNLEDIKMERKYLDEDKILELINYLKERKHKIIALIQTMTGVRAGDVLRLKRGSIAVEDYKGNNVLRLNVIGKGSKQAVMYIHDPVARDIILDYITTEYLHDDYYFLEIKKTQKRVRLLDNTRLQYINYVWYWRDLQNAIMIAGLNPHDFATHDFRRCFARRAYERWKDVVVLQNLLHHNDPRTTMRYLKQSGLDNIDYLKEMQQ